MDHMESSYLSAWFLLHYYIIWVCPPVPQSGIKYVVNTTLNQRISFPLGEMAVKRPEGQIQILQEKIPAILLYGKVLFSPVAQLVRALH